ncbi:hypothetical protein HDU78_011467 [Chytriomyces hyalinus]|nr:hypothetical protein HDU78_011467 [Chytriomyces hyalinus]
MVSSALSKYGSMSALVNVSHYGEPAGRQDLPVMVNERHMTKYDFKATDETKMSFLKDDVIQVYQKASTY